MNPEKKKLPYIAPFEVVIHNKATDCWVSILGKVFNITPLIKQYEGQACVKPLVALAGKDLSHWFDAKTGAVRHRIHPVTGVLTPYCPNGAFPDVQCPVPDSEWRAINGPPWWGSPQYQIGLLTKRVRSLKIINMLTFQEVQINVCCEDTFRRIQERYSIFNKDPDSYSWKYFEKEIDLDKTMDENGIPDDRDRFVEYDMPQNYYVPAVFLFYKDDLKYSNGEEGQFAYNRHLSDDSISGLGVPYTFWGGTCQANDPCNCEGVEEEQQQEEYDACGWLEERDEIEEPNMREVSGI